MQKTPSGFTTHVFARPAIVFALVALTVFGFLILESPFRGDGVQNDGVGCFILAVCFGLLMAGFSSKRSNSPSQLMHEKLALVVTSILLIAGLIDAANPLLASIRDRPLITLSFFGGTIACVYHIVLGGITLARLPFLSEIKTQEAKIADEPPGAADSPSTFYL